MKKARKIIQPILFAIPLVQFALLYLSMRLADVLIPASISDWIVMLAMGLVLILPISTYLCSFVGIAVSSYCLYKKESKVANIVWIVLFVMLILADIFYISVIFDGVASV